ncbi:hypothetical protein [Streptomyces daliensis]|uniref:Uncharacterized protein n=1 Tax=Streptomyces daliensis TaxID=299421 RepID=A0A8T4IZS4_9ACTN|nr:hypothetical protein [Streptomyces daliensis]
MTTAQAIVPYAGAAAATFAASVAQAAQDRAADSLLDHGGELLRRMRRREPGDPPATPEEEAALAAVDRLPEDERLLLDETLGQWLAGRDLSDAALHRHLALVHREHRSSGSSHATAYGPWSTVIGRVDGDLHIGYGQQPGPAGRRDRQEERE